MQGTVVLTLGIVQVHPVGFVTTYVHCRVVIPSALGYLEIVGLGASENSQLLHQAIIPNECS